MQPKMKRIYLPKAKAIVGLVALAVVVLVAVKMVVSWRSFVQGTALSAGTVIRLLADTGAPLKSTEGRTNLLILGIAGGTHAGADLTDTMIILSIAPEQKKVALLSLPRDIWSDTLKDKINSAYHYGEEKKKGGGLVLAKAIIEDVSGLPIHYGVVIDFSGFTKVIDLVGGVTVTVPEAFTDPEFPIAGREEDPCGEDTTFACRYEALHFDAGSQLMNGQRALKYVRTRHAQGDEGTDFARSRRQQEVLVALKEKLVSPLLWILPSRSFSLLRAMDEATDTDMKIGELLTVGKIMTRVPTQTIQKISIEEELFAPPLNWYGRYVLLPKEDFPTLHTFIRSKLE